MEEFKSQLNRKTVLTLLVLALLVISIPLGTYLVKQTNIFKSKAAEIVNQLTPETPKFQGYIVEFKEAALKVKSTESERAAKEKHEEAKRDIFTRLEQGKEVSTLEKSKRPAPETQEPQILGEYFYTFNGMALDITESQVKKVKESPFVKAVYPNLEVKANLNDSVPLIGADKVWQLKDKLGNNINGKGVNIAVLDTGVDYTHPDLGASQISERDFQKIISDIRWYWVVSSDKSKFAAYEGGKIYVYSSTGQKLNEFNLPDKEKYIAQMVIEGNYLAYFSNDEYGNNAGVSLYNLATGEHAIVDSTNVVGTMHIYGDTLYYGTGQDSWREPNPSYDIKNVGFSIYNIPTKNVSTYYPAVSPMNTYTIMGAFDKKQVAFPVPEKDGNVCAKNIDVLNFENFQISTYTPPDVGLVLDFKGDEVLYMACDSANFDSTGSSYYLFNIKTGVATKLTYLPESSSATSGSERFNGILPRTKDVSTKGSTFNWNRYNLGLIGDSIVYFKKNFYSNKVIIYNKIQQKYYPLNIILPIYRFVSSGDTICFDNSGFYCHNYDPNHSYSVPINIFNSKVVGGYNFIEPGEFPLDDHGHGTHVAATIAGNSILNGVAPEANIIAYKVLNSWGSGYFSDIIAAIEKSAQTRLDDDSQNDIDIISMSLGATCWGGYNEYCGPDDVVSRVVDNVVDTGISVVVAAGNSGPSTSTIGTPGTARKAITVGAVDKNKQLAYFSSRGPVTYNGETILKPDIVAPGTSICAAEWANWQSGSRCVDDKHISISGTSMATPHVAGLVALIKQANSDLSPAEIKKIITDSAQDLGLSVNEQGKGLVDSVKAVSLIPTPPPASGSASFSLSAPGNVGVGERFNLSVLATSDELANLFSAKIKYPKDYLKFESFDLLKDSTFVKNWVNYIVDEESGVIDLVGGVPSPGFNSSVPAKMAEIIFQAKQEGQATISFDKPSAIYRNSDNVNILKKTTEAILTIIPSPTVTPTPIPSPTPIPAYPSLHINFIDSQGDPVPYESCGVYWSCNGGNSWTTFKCQKSTSRTLNLVSSHPAGWCKGVAVPGAEITEVTPVPDDGFRSAVKDRNLYGWENSWAKGARSVTFTIGIKGDINGDGKITLVDISALLSRWNKEDTEAGRADLNGDKVVNSVDYSQMKDILLDKGVIKSGGI